MENLNKKRDAVKAEIANLRNKIEELALVKERSVEQSNEMKNLQVELRAKTDILAGLNEEMRSLDITVKQAEKSENEKLREFIRSAKAGEHYQLRDTVVATSTSDTTPYVQGLSIKEVIKSDRPDNDIFAAAGIQIPTGVTGNKIQWAYIGGVEAAFANELAKTTERKADLGAQTPVQQRLTVRVRVSNQTLENANFDLKSYFVQAVQDSVREKLNFAAVSTTKATSTFYGGFAQSAESGTYGASGYTAGKQTGTYTTLSKEMFAGMISKLAVRNIPLNNIAFVMGAEDYWTAKVTPTDTGSGIMLLGSDNKILGVPVICNNAINRSTARGAVSGHNIGLGNFAGVPTMNHGNIRLTVDNSSAFAADTDETIVTLNADYSMTVLKTMADAFVVYSKTQATGGE